MRRRKKNKLTGDSHRFSEDCIKKGQNAKSHDGIANGLIIINMVVKSYQEDNNNQYK